MTGARGGRPWWGGAGTVAVRLEADEVRRAAVRRLEQLGVPADDARVTAEHLLEGNLRGYPAQGLSRLRQIAEMIAGGALDPRVRPSTVRSAPAAALVESGRGLGPPAAAAAVAVGRELAAQCGVAVVGVRDAGHLGMLAPWAEQCAGDRFFSLVMTSSEPGVAVPGGGQPVFGTNPIAYAWPGPEGPVSADFATSVVSRSALLDAAERGSGLPVGAAVDAAGRPTRDAVEAMAGALLPLAPVHKGALLCLLSAMLTGPVVGGPPAHEVTGTRQTGRPPRKADFFLLIDLSCGIAGDDFARQAESLLDHLAGVGDGTFRRPGEGSAGRRRRALADGIELDAGTVELLWPDVVPA
jgi:LDH2 family malate/lactate/ureidoglycolate dehydrogenase